MWYASKNGLHRWDGYQFKTYQHDPFDSTTIAGDYVEFIYLANDGALWLSVGDDSKSVLMDRFDPRTETFHHYNYQPELPINQRAYEVATIIEDAKGNIWMGTHYGVYKLDSSTGIFQQYLNEPDNPNSLSHNVCRSIYLDAQGTLWLGTGLFWDASSAGGLNRYRPETDDFTQYFHDPDDTKSLQSNIITELFEDSRGDFWVGTTKGGLHKMNRQEGTFHRVFPGEINTSTPSIKISNYISNTFVQFIFEDQEHNLWIGYFYAGILHYNPVTGIKELFEPDKDIPGSLPEKYVWSLFQSREGTLWGSTTGPEGTVFKIKQTNFNTYGLASATNYIGALCESEDQNIWLATYETGVFQLDLKTNALQSFTPQAIRPSKPTGENSTVLHDKNEALKMVAQMVEDNSGGLWLIKDAFPGLIHFDPYNKIMTTYTHDPNAESSISAGAITDILKDAKGSIWIVTSQGDLSRYDAAADNFVRFKNTALTDYDSAAGYKCQLTLSEDGSLLLAGTGAKPGLSFPFISKFDPENGTFQDIELKLSAPERISIDKEIIDLKEDSKGHIWFCNSSHLFEIDPNMSLLEIYPAHQLHSETIKGMEVDKQGNIWMIGENISVFDPLADELSVRKVSANTIKNFPGFKQATLITRDGLIYIGGDGLLNSFAPEVVGHHYRHKPPESTLTDFQLLDGAGAYSNSIISKVLANEAIMLNHDQNTFSLRFTTLSFQEPQNNRIKYKLEGYDESWRMVEIEPTVTYIKIPPGDYTFLLQGATATSDWGPKKEYRIHICPPIWATWWAYAAYGLLSFGLLYLLNKFQLSRKMEKVEASRLQELDRIKNRLFANISHEFRTPLTVIAGMSSQIKEDPDKWLDEGVNIIERNCARLLDLVNQMLDLSKLENGKLELQLVQADSIAFVKHLCENFYFLAEEHQLTLMVYPETEEVFMDFDPKKLATIVINLLSNAIKFSLPGDKIIVHLNRVEANDETSFLLKVKDSGPGIPQDALEGIFDRYHQVDSSSTRTVGGTGIGLALTKELTELMGGVIGVKSKLGTGSEFVVQLPITKDAPVADEVLLPYPAPISPRYSPPEEGVQQTDLPLVLIIEDNEDVSRYLKMCLEEKYSLIYAKDGTAGIELACEKIPDIIISDIMMPGTDGIEVCSVLKKDQRTDHIPIILLTAKASLQDKISGLSHGADAYMVKPFHKAELLTRLEQLILLRQKMATKVQRDPYALFLEEQVEEAAANFLKKAIEQIHQHLSEHSFGSLQLAHKLRMSESQVYRKLKAISGKSTAVFIRSVRLQKARELILKGQGSISSIAYEVGFNDPSWFSRAFKEEFGYPPSELSK